MGTDFVIVFIFERELKKDDLIEVVKIFQEETGSEVDIKSRILHRKRLTNIEEVIPQSRKSGTHSERVV